MFGQVVGRFFLGPHCGITGDDDPDTVTVSELVETFPHWPQIVKELPHKNKYLYTMFETTDVHPEIIEKMKVFDKVIVPFDYLKNILVKHGVRCESMNWYTSDLIRLKPKVIQKETNPKSKIFLYVGTNDKRKNVTTLTKTFAKVSEGTEHILIVKTNKPDGLTLSPNIKIITDKISLEKLAALYNLCDYVISFSRGEGVGLPMLEADYFGKPVIAHDRGVFEDIKKFIKVPWIDLPCEEIKISLEGVPKFLHEVFYGTWFDVKEDEAFKVLQQVLKNG